jgi:glycosyltransferase involved in cell wall biosynthesis
MRILLAIASLGPGGAERVLTLLAGGLAGNGHELIVLAPTGMRDSELTEVPHLRVELGVHGRDPRGIAAATFELASSIRRFRPDLVHAQNVRIASLTGVGARLARPLRRPPVLATFHGVLPSEYKGAARALRLTDHVACVSEDLRDALLDAGYPAARTSVVYNAVARATAPSSDRLAAIDSEFGLDGAPVAAIVARLVPQKAHWRFVRAASVAARRVPDARFLIVGDGPLRSQIEAAVRSAGLDDRVVFTGVREDARELSARADVLVFSSEWEGLSIAALEAMAAGTPVLATDVQGMRELLAGGAGETVPLDEGDALGERLADLLLDRQRRAAMSETGKASIEGRHSVAAMTGAYERIYRELTAR